MCAAVPAPAVTRPVGEVGSTDRMEPSPLVTGVRLPPASTPRVLFAGAGDHPAIFQCLQAVFHGPSREGFYASFDDPFYEPKDRLLIKRGERIVSHVHLTQRVVQLGSLFVPAAGLFWLGTLPEYRGQGHASTLLAAADGVMAADQTVLGVLTTRQPHFFRRQGWVVCGRHSQARAGSRHLLAQLSAAGLPPAEAPLNIRPLRQMELPALMRLYARHSAGAWGPYQRSEAYWRWLISRQGYHHVFVAIQGPDRCELEDAGAAIVGYAVTRDDHVVELVTDPTHPTAAEELLARACSEAIERDYHAVVLHAPPGQRLFKLFEAAGGTLHQHEAHQGEVYMVRLLKAFAFLRSLVDKLHARADVAGLARPCELGLAVDDEKHRLIATRRSVKLVCGRLGRSYLRLSPAELTRLVLGHHTVDEAVAAGRIAASTQLALETARVFFPRLPLWRSPWDDMTV